MDNCCGEQKRNVETCATLDSIPKSVCSATECARRRCQLSTGQRSSTLRLRCSLISGYNIPPAVARQECCLGMAITIPGHNAIRLLLVGFVKQHVYSERINDINHLKQRITDVIRSVTPDVRVCEEMDYRSDVCRSANGALIELR
ncbi:hypothetical protein AVEN_261392-1 [Araneus ventricosus]|uniref:Uncharacterized protein n=1 Tax=Araneus ventricosus TaxID=182803 RepID=A0A4Y2X9Z6_ARAVE|nr:hypothetical protein AVEN_261392-1 [Araneus ventricosus]